MSKLIVISAPSGAGKTTLCSRLLQDFPILTLSISTTSRAARGQEQHGRDYFFVSHEEFEAQIKQSLFAEWANVHGNYYGTSKLTIERAFKQGKLVLLDIDVQGAESLRVAYPGSCYSVFIAPPGLEALEARLRARGTDQEASIQKRMGNARTEMLEAEKFNCTVVNDDLERAYQELKNCVSLALDGKCV